MTMRGLALSFVLLSSVGSVPAQGVQGQGSEAGAARRPEVNVQVLEDPGNVSIDPYLLELVKRVRARWDPPAGAAGGPVAISIVLREDGTLDAVHLDSPVGDEAVTKAAWAAVSGTTFAPLPWGLRERKLRLRVRLFVG